MKKILLTYFPNAAVIFTASLLATGLLSLMTGSNYEISAIFLLEYFAFIIVSLGLNQLLLLLPFKRRAAYVITDILTLYFFFLAYAHVFQWFTFKIQPFVMITGTFIAVCCGLHLYFAYVYRKQAKEINSLLKAK